MTLSNISYQHSKYICLAPARAARLRGLLPAGWSFVLREHATVPRVEGAHIPPAAGVRVCSPLHLPSHHRTCAPPAPVCRLVNTPTSQPTHHEQIALALMDGHSREGHDVPVPQPPHQPRLCSRAVCHLLPDARGCAKQVRLRARGASHMPCMYAWQRPATPRALHEGLVQAVVAMEVQHLDGQGLNAVLHNLVDLWWSSTGTVRSIRRLDGWMGASHRPRRRSQRASRARTTQACMLRAGLRTIDHSVRLC